MGAVVGVAAPIIVRFSSDPSSQKAEIQKRMKVVTSPVVVGSWAWITHDGDTYPSLDWRPKAYWPQFTKVHVEANVYGAAFSESVYGSADVTSDFSIGRNQVVIANAKKHDMVVKQSGKTVATYPGSYGMGDDPNSRYGLNPELVTRSGIHIVMDKQQTVLMNNPKYGYTNSVEHWAVRISDNGEFIHENPNTVGDHGNTNVSHGCIKPLGIQREGLLRFCDLRRSRGGHRYQRPALMGRRRHLRLGVVVTDLAVAVRPVTPPF